MGAALYAIAGTTSAPVMAASRAGSRTMMAPAFLSSKPPPPAISSAERPQPMHRPETGCSAQTRLHGVLTSASIVLIGPLTRTCGHHKRVEQKASICDEINKSRPKNVLL